MLFIVGVVMYHMSANKNAKTTRIHNQQSFILYLNVSGGANDEVPQKFRLLSAALLLVISLSLFTGCQESTEPKDYTQPNVHSL